MQEPRLDIRPDSIRLFQLVFSRLKSADTPENVFFDAGEVDSWKLDGKEYPTDTIGQVREGLQRLEKIREASALIAAAAEAFIPEVKTKLMQIGLLSFPTEIIQEILCLSTLDERSQTFDLKRVLKLQKISRCFRDIVQSTPELWTSISMKNVSLLRLQLERSGKMGLHLVAAETGFLTPELYQLVANHSMRLRTVAIHLRDPAQRSLVFNLVYQLNAEKLQSLEFYAQPRPGEALRLGRLRAPKLSRLLLHNVYETDGTGVNLIELVVSYGDYSRWSGLELLSLIRRHQKLERLFLSIRSPPQDQLEFAAEGLMNNYSTSERDMLVVLKFDSWASRKAFWPIWPALLTIGVGTLKLDLSAISKDVLAGSFCSELLFNCFAHTAPSIHTLFISFPPYAPHNCLSEGSRPDWEFPLSLRTITIDNCPGKSFETLFFRIILLELKQRAFGARPLEDLFFTGYHPPQDFIYKYIKCYKLEVPISFV